MSQTLTRRTFIHNLSLVGGAVVGVGVLAGCKSAEPETVALTCTDVSALTEDQKTTRETLHYVDTSVTEGKQCNNCQQNQPADPANPTATTACGKCLVVPGPIHPMGYCDSWAEKVA